MIGDVALVMGYEKLEGEVTYAGFDVKQYRQLGVCGASDLPVRYVGLYERQDNCTTKTLKFTCVAKPSNLILVNRKTVNVPKSK
jgi:phage tail tube protein FII